MRRSLALGAVVVAGLGSGLAITRTSATGPADGSPPDSGFSKADWTSIGIKVSYRSASNLEWVLREYASKDFGGSGVTTDLSHVLVYLPSDVPLQASEDHLRAIIAEIERREDMSVVTETGQYVPDTSPHDVEVQVAQRDLTVAGLLATWELVFNERPADPGNMAQVEWQAGVSDRVQGYIPDWVSGTLEVPVLDLRPEDVALVKAAFGNQIRLVEGELQAAKGRLDDPSPHRGGSSITYSYGGGVYQPVCSTAFTTQSKSSGTKKLLTAGHCLTDADWWSSYGGYFMGGTSDYSYGQGLTDDQTISGSTYSPVVRIGSNPFYNGSWPDANWDNSNSYDVVKAVGKPGPGSPIRVSGTRTGDAGAYTIRANTNLQCAVLSGVNTCNVRKADFPYGSPIFDAGDSGGAIYWYQSSQLQAVGILNGGTTVMAYTPIDYILNQFGLALVTA